MHQQRLRLVILAVVGMVSACLPWATVPSLSLSVFGIAGTDGFVAIGVFALAVALALSGSRERAFDPGSRAFAIAIGVAAVLGAVWKIRIVQDLPGVHVGIGVWMIGATGVAIAAISTASRAVDPEPAR